MGGRTTIGGWWWYDGWGWWWSCWLLLLPVVVMAESANWWGYVSGTKLKANTYSQVLGMERLPLLYSHIRTTHEDMIHKCNFIRQNNYPEPLLLHNKSRPHIKILCFVLVHSNSVSDSHPSRWGVGEGWRSGRIYFYTRGSFRCVWV